MQSSASTSFPLKSLLLGASFLTGTLLLLYKLKRRPQISHSHEERQRMIKLLTEKQLEISKALEKLYLEEKIEESEAGFPTQPDEPLENIDYSIPLNDPAINHLKSSSKIFLIKENQKMKDRLLLLGDYINLQEKEYDGEYSFHFKDPEDLKRKIKDMKADGIEELQIVSDFDMTTTCFKINGKHCDSLFGSFRTTDYTSHSFKKTTQSLYNSYGPIEIDPNIDIQQKRILLKEWYEAVKVAFLHEGITKQKCLNVLNDANFGVRYGYREFFNICKVMNLPYYMISGGITEMVQTILAKAADIKNYSNFFTFSNDMIFDKDGVLEDMNMKVYATTKYGILDKRKFSFKKNTLLFGDLVTDYDMASKMSSKNLIAIAFLESGKEEMLKNYLEKFDVVIQGDGDFLLHDKLLRHVAGIEENPYFRERINSNKSFEDVEKLFI